MRRETLLVPWYLARLAWLRWRKRRIDARVATLEERGMSEQDAELATRPRGNVYVIHPERKR